MHCLACCTASEALPSVFLTFDFPVSWSRTTDAGGAALVGILGFLRTSGFRVKWKEGRKEGRNGEALMVVCRVTCKLTQC